MRPPKTSWITSEILPAGYAHPALVGCADSPRLSAKAREIIGQRRNPCFFSLASNWEMSIKSSTGKLRLTVPVREFVVTHLAANGFKQLDLNLNHVTRVESLAWHHRDPFDRLLVAQAMEENLSIISADQSMTLYAIECIW